MRVVQCSVCGKETLLPPVLGDIEDGDEPVDVVEDGRIVRSWLKDGKLVRDPEPIPIYCMDCFQAAFGEAKNQAKPPAR